MNDSEAVRRCFPPVTGRARHRGMLAGEGKAGHCVVIEVHERPSVCGMAPGALGVPGGVRELATVDVLVAPLARGRGDLVEYGLPSAVFAAHMARVTGGCDVSAGEGKRGAGVINRHRVPGILGMTGLAAALLDSGRELARVLILVTGGAREAFPAELRRLVTADGRFPVAAVARHRP